LIKAGDELTISGEIITIGGQIIFTKGQKVIVDEVIIEKGHYSKLCPDIWYDDKVLWVKIVGQYGLWTPEAFVEDLNKI
jgi:hypothetical protein